MASERRDRPSEPGGHKSEKRRRRRKKHHSRQDAVSTEEPHRRSYAPRDSSGEESGLEEARDRSPSHRRSRRHGHSDPERRRRKSRKHRPEEEGTRRVRKHRGHSTGHRRTASDGDCDQDSSCSSGGSDRDEHHDHPRPRANGISRSRKRHTVHIAAPPRIDSYTSRPTGVSDDDGARGGAQRPTSLRRSNTTATHRRSQGMLSTLFSGPLPKPVVRRRATANPVPEDRPEETGRMERRSPSPKPLEASRRPTSSAKKSHRRVSIWDALKTPPPAPATPKEVELVECIICLSDDIPSNKSVKLACSHRMCHACIKRSFVLSTTDPAHMPPKCCTDDHIPLDKVARLFTDKFKRIWNRKYAEYTTKNRLYCPHKGCGEWIPPSAIKLDSSVGRRYGTCKKCKTKVCKKCGLKWHGSKECANDAETQRVLELGEESGWKRCYSCKALVQLGEGCNHMKCRCSAEFCMVCGKRWKTCDCPLFPVPPDTVGLGFGGMPPPPFDALRFVEIFHQERRMDPFQDLFPQLARRREQRQGRNGARQEGLAAAPRPPLPPDLHYAPPVRRREPRNIRTQEDADEALARQLQEVEFTGRGALNDVVLDPFRDHNLEPVVNQTRAPPSRPAPVNQPGVLLEYLNGHWNPVPERPPASAQQAGPPPIDQIPVPRLLGQSPTEERNEFWDLYGRGRLRRVEREERAAERAASTGGEAELAGLDGRRDGILRVEGWRRGVE